MSKGAAQTSNKTVLTARRGGVLELYSWTVITKRSKPQRVSECLDGVRPVSMEEVISLELQRSRVWVGDLLRITSRDIHGNGSTGGLLDDLHIYKHPCLPSLHIKSQLPCACFSDFVMFWSCILIKLWHIEPKMHRHRPTHGTYYLLNWCL